MFLFDLFYPKVRGPTNEMRSEVILNKAARAYSPPNVDVNTLSNEGF